MRRDAIIVGVLLTIIMGLGLAGGLRQSRQASMTPLLRDSTAHNGASALREWLEAVDQTVSTERVGERFEVPAGVGLVLMLQPSQAPSPRELNRLEDWVEDGGTLLIVGSTTETARATEHFGFEQAFYFQSDPQPAEPMTVAIQQQIGWDSAEIDPTAYFEPDNNDFVTHLAVENFPILISSTRGEGMIILSTLWEPFSNNGVQRDGNRELIINLFGLAQFEGDVWFDEWHHGERSIELSDEIIGPSTWARRTPIGQALLYTIALIYIVSLWRGRRFGRPVPLPNTVVRRAPLEYITAIANMNRRAGNRQAIIDDYRLRLKRQLGARHRIDPSLPDNEYLKILQSARPDLEIGTVQRLLQRLRSKEITEQALVALATDITTFLNEQ